MVVEKLEELGLADNTILIFTSDNGGESDWKKAVTNNAPLRAGKSTLYEGGIRVPLIVAWPGRIQEGRKCDFPVITHDFYPTLLQLANIPFPENQLLDGISLLPLLKDKDEKLDRNTLYWHYPLEERHFLGGRSSGAIREEGWKLIEFFDTGDIELYNLEADPGEEIDLATAMPQKVRIMQAKLNAWQNKITTASAADD